MVDIPETEWQKIQTLTERILHRSYEQEEDCANLNNLMHSLHGEGIRGERWTGNGRPAVFVNGIWFER